MAKLRVVIFLEGKDKESKEEVQADDQNGWFKDKPC